MTGIPASNDLTFPDNQLNASLSTVDSDIAKAVSAEHLRQENEIELIASENIVSRAVMEAQGSVMTNKYAEGYPGRRYYGGCEHVDIAEELAQERARDLFSCSFANVQPHSGAQANQSVFFALLSPGDIYMGLSLAEGGHLTHGSPVNQSGRWFHAIPYGLLPDSQTIDYDKVHELASRYKPKLIIAGGSAYPRIIDFRRFREIADEVGALLMVDMAHFAGLVAGKAHPNPLEFADVVTTTTHKTLRGPRGGMILSNNEQLGKRINSAVFPGLQGGPLMHVIAAKAVAFHEAQQDTFKAYANSVIENSKQLAQTLTASGIDLVSGGTDTHLMLLDLRSLGLTGQAAEAALSRAGITCNKNGVPDDPQPPQITSGIRLGTPACTTRGFGTNEFKKVGDMIATVLNGLSKNGEKDNLSTEQMIANQARELTNNFPIYSRLNSQ